MTDTEINIPLLRKTVEWAEAEAAKPRELSNWEQDWWVSTDGTYTVSNEDGSLSSALKDPSCGTCFCIAGQMVYSCLNEGERLDSDVVQDAVTGETIMTVPERALELLGIESDTPYAFPLFDAHNSIEDVRRIAEELAGERL